MYGGGATLGKRMTETEMKALLDDISRVRVAVLGDYCLDAYWFIEQASSEVSIETGLNTRPVCEQRYSLGGAGNVAINLRALGCVNIHVLGVTGADPFGREMHKLLNALQIDTAGLIIQEEQWNTHAYIKPHIGDEEQPRIDFGSSNSLDPAISRALLAQVERVLANIDILVINEQVAGGVHADETFRTALRDLLARHPDRLFILDSRNHSDFYEGTCRKINDHEATRLCGIERSPIQSVSDDEARTAAETLFGRWNKPVFITRGERGCLVCTEAGVQEIPGIRSSADVDPVGAGDSLLAGVALALGAGRNVLTAAQLGNIAAGITVRKLRCTGTASPEEIMGFARE